MIAYEFYLHNGDEKEHFIGILPERRKDSNRVTRRSIMNWAKKTLGHNEDFKKIYFLRVEI
jgi:hypothetical protein